MVGADELRLESNIASIVTNGLASLNHTRDDVGGELAGLSLLLGRIELLLEFLEFVKLILDGLLSEMFFGLLIGDLAESPSSPPRPQFLRYLLPPSPHPLPP